MTLRNIRLIGGVLFALFLILVILTLSANMETAAYLELGASLVGIFLGGLIAYSFVLAKEQREEKERALFEREYTDFLSENDQEIEKEPLEKELSY